MDHTSALVTTLKALLSDLELGGLDGHGFAVASSTADLHTTLGASVTSMVGLQLVLLSDGVPIVLAVPSPSADGSAAVTSLRLTLDWLLPLDDQSMITFFASRPGAFVDLAADLRYVLGVTSVTLDDALERSGRGAAPVLTGVGDFAAINRAVGVLIGHGWGVDGARAELARQASDADISLSTAAERVLRR